VKPAFGAAAIGAAARVADLNRGLSAPVFSAAPAGWRSFPGRRLAARLAGPPSVRLPGEGAVRRASRPFPVAACLAISVGTRPLPAFLRREKAGDCNRGGATPP